MITMNNRTSTVTIIYELFIFLLWNPSKMKYPSFLQMNGSTFFKRNNVLSIVLRLAKIGYLKVISSKSFSVARLWRLLSKMKCNSFSILLDEQCWHILTFSGISGTQCLPVSNLKSCRFNLCCECKESREYRKWSIKRRYSNKHRSQISTAPFP